MSNGYTVDEFFEAVEFAAGEVLTDYIASEVDKIVKPRVCELLRDFVTKVRVRVARLNPVLRVVRALVDIVDGFLADIESIRIGTLRVPRTLTNPIRQFVDRVQELLDTVDEFVGELLSELVTFEEYCDGES